MLMPGGHEILTIALAGLASATLIGVMLHGGYVGALDRPNQRSLHTHPVPRSGGLGILLALAAGLIVSAAPPWLYGSVLLLAAVSWLDDQMQVPVFVRFGCHFVAAGMVAVGGGLPESAAWGSVLMVLGIVWMTNLFNFMDGADGLAAGMALIGFAVLGVAAWSANAVDGAVLAGCIAAGAAGFLWFNFQPARIFLGDVGSIPLGFLAATLGLGGVRQGWWPLWFPLLVFSPFIVDASLTLLRRMLRGDKLWLAHRDHYYQRLIRQGWSHRRLALAEYGLMAAAGASALALRHAAATVQLLGLAAWLIIYAAATAAIDCRWQRHGSGAPR